MTSPLFSMFSLRELELQNRVVVSPMAQYSADPTGEANDWHLMHLGSLAVSGAGLVITEAIAVEPRGRVTPGCVGLWTDEQEQALSRVVRFCKQHGGAKLGIQLAHAGRKASTLTPWQRAKTLTIDEGGWQPVSCSSLEYPGRNHPLQLDDAGLDFVKRAFAGAAERANRLGFDLIEIHGAHGYLIHSFLSPLTNNRTDKYGGDLEKRMRFPLEIFEAIRSVWPAHKPLGMRISATDWVEGGWDIDQSVEFARALKNAGCDFMAVSSGGLAREQKIPTSPGYQIPFAERIRNEVGIPTIGVGLITDPHHAEQIVASGKADLIAIGREMLYDPRWVWRASEKLGVSSVYLPPQYERCYPAAARA